MVGTQDELQVAKQPPAVAGHEVTNGSVVAQDPLLGQAVALGSDTSETQEEWL
ncbi:MAG: hypothetical protein HQL12_09080 [Candidatus Omnitrophica bacterium]|nr:hypothetical protein [Candidatus Omnitrophota bacterium]